MVVELRIHCSVRCLSRYIFIRPSSWSPISGQFSRNDGRSWQTGCPEITGNGTDAGSWTEYVGLSEIGERVSLSHLCNVLQWYQGEFDDREIRVNFDNYIQLDSESWVQGIVLPGEGLYGCANRGTCIAPDNCSCADGWSGFDCNNPECRHLNAEGDIVGCLNDGICENTDTCVCVQYESTLWEDYPEMRREHPDAITGYNGSDCSIPMCVQAKEFDEECAFQESPLLGDAASGGEGCFRCHNGGYCTAPDTCTCPPQWTGYDCQTPVCTIKADRNLILQLQTFDVQRIHDFEEDPCLTGEGHGNCTQPNVCTCYCEKERSGYSYIAGREEDNLLSKTEFKEEKDERGYDQGPWQDPLGRTLGVNEIYGSNFPASSLLFHVPTCIKMLTFQEFRLFFFSQSRCCTSRQAPKIAAVALRADRTLSDCSSRAISSSSFPRLLSDTVSRSSLGRL
eukprot:INCI14711.3.p2 GENE.INCI14711.3~~INCI14711.3.p2  ORF type:complete len:452 (-),score=45.66 INCI14711.3:258-1613(-)